MSMKEILACPLMLCGIDRLDFASMMDPMTVDSSQWRSFRSGEGRYRCSAASNDRAGPRLFDPSAGGEGTENSSIFNLGPTQTGAGQFHCKCGTMGMKTSAKAFKEMPHGILAKYRRNGLRAKMAAHEAEWMDAGMDRRDGATVFGRSRVYAAGHDCHQIGPVTRLFNCP